MKLSEFLYLSAFGIKTVIFRNKQPIVGSVILTDRCNLNCRHCSVNNITGKIYSYEQIISDMELIYKMGVRMLFLYGGEPFLWNDGGHALRDIVLEAKKRGFFSVSVVTNGTFPMDLPEADLIMVSLDGDRTRHNLIRGNTYDTVMENIRNSPSGNICLYMSVNKLNKDSVREVCLTAQTTANVRAVSFNFHTPYPDTEELALSPEEKEKICGVISEMMKKGVPVLNLKTAFPYIIKNTFPVPCRQSLVIENGTVYTCGRCIATPGLCGRCGYFFAAEYGLAFSGKISVIADMLKTYLKYI